MKTRAEIYGNEAAALLRIVTMYPGLNMQQLLCFHPGKSETAKTLLSHLERQGTCPENTCVRAYKAICCHIQDR